MAMEVLLRVAHDAVTNQSPMLSSDVPTESAAAVVSTQPAALHALNILRALYRDSRLGEQVASFVPRGVEVAIAGFSANHWPVRLHGDRSPCCCCFCCCCCGFCCCCGCCCGCDPVVAVQVRNSSNLLFTALVLRMFGAKRVQDEHSMENKLTAREFFARFPTLYPYLLQQLQESAQQLQAGKNSK